VLNTPRSLEQVAASVGMPADDARALLELARQRIYQLRQERVQPALDDKVLTSWNGLMIGAMAEGARILGHDRYFISAARAARHVLSTLRRPDGGLYRVVRAGKVQLDGVLEDYAFLADGLISLYEASGQFEHSRDAAEFLYAARVLAERLTLDFGGEDGAFHATGRQHEELLLRRRDGHDGALPSANAVSARALTRLGQHFGRSDWTELGVGALEAHAVTIERAPRAFATSLNALERTRERPTEIVTAGKPGDTKLRVLLARAASVYLPHAAWANAEPDQADADQLPMTRGKTPVNGSPALYLCSNFVCQAPILDADDVVPALQSVRPLQLATSATASAAPTRAD
jgi:uncharacterized protein YyaL (SSP411 family)